MLHTGSRRPLLLAGLGSFLVYLMPVVGPHAFFVLGEMVAGSIGRLARGEQPLWSATNLGFALLLQLAAFVVLYWVLTAGRWRWLAPVAAAPLAIWAANAAYLDFIPTLFLLEDQPAVERGHWPVACEIAGTHLLPLRAGVRLELAGVREAWIAREPGGHHEILTMPGCRANPRGIERSMTVAVDRVAPGGAALYRRQDKATGKPSYWFSAGTDTPSLSLTPPSDKWWAPVLSRGAEAIAWVESERAGSRGFDYRVVIRDLEDDGERRIPLEGALWSRPYLLSVDMQSGEMTFSTDFDKVVTVDMSGAITWGPVELTGFGSLQMNFLRHADGWVVWDGYREEGRYRVHWSLPLGEGRHEIPKGRGINAVAVDPWGRYIAVSVTSNLSIGDARDEMYVLRVHDGEEVFRRYLDRYTRTQVAFLGPHYLAFTRYDSIVEGVGGRVQVLRVPGPVGWDTVDAWVDAYRARVEPLLALSRKLDDEGLGEEDCAPFAAALARPVPPAPDDLTADLARALDAAIGEARLQCDRWDPSPFVTAFLDVEHLVGSMEDHLLYEYGVEVFPSTSLLTGDRRDGRIGPLEMPDGSVRAKRTRAR